MPDKKKIRRIVLRINPDYEEHLKLEKQIHEMVNKMGLTNTQAVIMLLKEKEYRKDEGHFNLKTDAQKLTANLAVSDSNDFLQPYEDLY